MGIEQPEISRRLLVFQAGLTDRGLSGALLTSEPNFVYLTGLHFDALWTSAARSMAVVVPDEGPPTLVIPTFLVEEAKESLPESEVIGYDPPRQAIESSLMAVLQGLSPGPIGIETGPESRPGLTLDSADSVRTSAQSEVRDVSDLLWRLRMIKTPAEVANMQQAALAGSRAFAAVFADGVVGRSERELARHLASVSLAEGADQARWVACTSGTGSYHRFVSAPRDRIVEPGDMFWADLGLTTAGYWTDFCRAAIAGEVSSERTELQDITIAATDAGVAACKPGMTVEQVAATIRRRSAELGVELLSYGRLGHGIGLSSTEPPSIAEWDDTVLQPGMVVTIEPAFTHPSGLYCAEQVVVVTDDQPEVLTTAPTDLTAG